MRIDFFGVGVNRAVDPLSTRMRDSLPALNYPASDAQKVLERFEDKFDLCQKIVLHDGPSASSAGLPSRIGVLGGLKKFADLEMPDKGDVLVFYFAGHGVMLNQEFGLCPRDFSGDAPEYSVIPMSEVVSIATRAYRVNIFIFDCCRRFHKNGRDASRVDGRAGQFLMPACRFPMMHHALSFFSCSPGEASYETDTFTSGFGGVFTHFFCDRLAHARGTALSLRGIFDRTRDQVSSFTAQNLQVAQTPTYFGSDIGAYSLRPRGR